jgi:hypothetical protein
MQDLKTFEVGRAMLEDYLDTSVFPARLDVTEAKSLHEALENQQVTPETPLLTFENEEQLYGVPMTVVLSYNVIQGQTTDEQPWMMTFCNACNTGMVFDPVVDGQTLHFRRRGSYDGLLLIWDEETDSYWQHITGECLYGPSRGKQLRTITTTRRMTTLEAVGGNAKPHLLTKALTPEQERLSRAMEKMRANPEKVEAGIFSLIVVEDTRRPRFELGLGIWNGHTSSFFPLTLLHQHNNALMTEFDGRQMLIYQTPEAISPVAVYTNSKQARWAGDVLRLDNGTYIQNDMYYTAERQSRPLERPTQLLMRWYGFALTFPGCNLPRM